MRLTFYGGEACFFFFSILVPTDFYFYIYRNWIFLLIGALFGPAMTKWYQLLNRIRFPSPAKALIYRVSNPFSICGGAGNIRVNNFIFWVHRFGLTKLSLHQVRFSCSPRSNIYSNKTYFIVAVAFFYGSMSVLEGKPEEVTSRVKAVRQRVLLFSWWFFSHWLF